MLATVAVGTDGSATAAKAVDAAAEIAERFGSKLVLLSAFEGTDSPTGSGSGAHAPASGK